MRSHTAMDAKIQDEKKASEKNVCAITITRQ